MYRKGYTDCSLWWKNSTYSAHVYRGDISVSLWCLYWGTVPKVVHVSCSYTYLLPGNATVVYHLLYHILGRVIVRMFGAPAMVKLQVQNHIPPVFEGQVQKVLQRRHCCIGITLCLIQCHCVQLTKWISLELTQTKTWVCQSVSYWCKNLRLTIYISDENTVKLVYKVYKDHPRY